MTITERVNTYLTKHKEGFISSELDELLKEYPNIDIGKFNEAMMGNTCMVKEGQVIMYHCDIELAIRCGIEKRNVRGYEMD
jgi:hypothetical protein